MQATTETSKYATELFKSDAEWLRTLWSKVFDLVTDPEATIDVTKACSDTKPIWNNYICYRVFAEFTGVFDGQDNRTYSVSHIAIITD